MNKRVIELCVMHSERIVPFAVLVESKDNCAWSIAAETLPELDQNWLGYVITQMDRRAEDFWVLSEWQDWLTNIAHELPESRQRILNRTEWSTPGIIIRKPKNIISSLPVGAIAARWRKDRLFDRSEVIAAEIAHKLAKGGFAHWDSSITFDECHVLEGGWIIESPFALGKPVHSTDIASGLAILQAINAHQIEEQKIQWQTAKADIGAKYPYGVAIVKDSKIVEILDTGSIIGDRFSSPVSLAVSTVRSQWLANAGN